MCEGGRARPTLIPVREAEGGELDANETEGAWRGPYVHMRGRREYLEGVKECKDRAKRDDDDGGCGGDDDYDDDVVVVGRSRTRDGGGGWCIEQRDVAGPSEG